MQHLDGVQAVAYMRLRQMDTDFARTERQRRVISQVFGKAKDTDPGTLLQVADTAFSQSLLPDRQRPGQHDTQHKEIQFKQHSRLPIYP